MDITWRKPSGEERALIAHGGIVVANPTEVVSAWWKAEPSAKGETASVRAAPPPSTT